ncbi:hypothetical protein DPSP01_002204 [Paraphaeosphaeria sporulosa]
MVTYSVWARILRCQEEVTGQERFNAATSSVGECGVTVEAAKLEKTEEIISRVQLRAIHQDQGK